MGANLDDIQRYLNDIYAPYVEKMTQEMTALRRMLAEGPPARKGHSRPPTEEEVAAFEAWKVRFEEVMDEGDRHGWLFRDYDMDPEPSAKHPPIFEFDETREEHEARAKEYWDLVEKMAQRPRPSVTFPVYQRPEEDDLNHG